MRIKEECNLLLRMIFVPAKTIHRPFSKRYRQFTCRSFYMKQTPEEFYKIGVSIFQEEEEGDNRLR